MCWCARCPTVNEYLTMQRTVEKVARSQPATVAEARAAFDKQKDIEYSISSITGKDLDHHQGKRQGRGRLRLRQARAAVRSGVPPHQVRGAVPIAASSATEGTLAALQQRLGYRFAQPAMLQRALTHRSWGAEHNERLEFLGDAVLSLAVSSLLFERFSGSDEGDLTRVRAHLVREDSLHRVALGLGLPRRCACPKAKCGVAARSARPSWPMPSKP
jgi:hypothetical protein